MEQIRSGEILVKANLKNQEEDEIRQAIALSLNAEDDDLSLALALSLQHDN